MVADSAQVSLDGWGRFGHYLMVRFLMHYLQNAPQKQQPQEVCLKAPEAIDDYTTPCKLF